jgi:hypothetical protein
MLVTCSVSHAEGKPARKLRVSGTGALVEAVASAEAGTVILVADGNYRLSRPLVFRTPGVTLRSESGNRDKVILDGKRGVGKLRRQNCANEIIAVRASGITIADLSICHARDHGVHIFPGRGGDIENVAMRNIHVYDCGQQLIKVNSNGGDPLCWADRGILEDSLVEFIDNSIMQDMGSHFYTGGLDVHGGSGWIIRRNTFRNIQRKGRLMEHAVHMWSKCRDTVVEQNRFIDCYRAVGFGMKRQPRGSTRQYRDGAGSDPYFGHVGGVIRNNFIFNRAGIHLESGIELMNVTGTRVYHNTVVSHDKPFSSIEYRWPNTRVRIMNNIVSSNIKRRNNADALLKRNIRNAPPTLFQDYDAGDLHLAPTAARAIDRGMPLRDAASKVDIDGNKRDAHPDIGADERSSFNPGPG